MFWGMGNHLEPISEASDRSEGQELCGGALGDQEGLQEGQSENGPKCIPHTLKHLF